MGRMPQAVAPLTVRKGNGPSPSFAHAVAPIGVSVGHAPIEVMTRPNVWLARCDLLFLVPYRRMQPQPSPGPGMAFGSRNRAEDRHERRTYCRACSGPEHRTIHKAAARTARTHY